MHVNQGLNGVYFVTPDGTKYITKDINSTLSSEKVIDKGTKERKECVQMNFGNGFSATYRIDDAGIGKMYPTSNVGLSTILFKAKNQITLSKLIKKIVFLEIKLIGARHYIAIYGCIGLILSDL
ncbi:MAG: hypothetical protein U5K51_17005 [Flavobacteriaceae bacterium]|nr:hypothetical protein [Flavobacteriaceae bacterium]